MKKQLLYALLLMGSTSLLTAQSSTTFTVRVSDAYDDHEEWLPGAGQTKTVGDMDAGSSDLEFGQENPNADPQLVGVRFRNVAIPANAVITNAYIQFAVDATAKNTDPCVVTLRAEDNANPNTYNDNAFCLTTRTLTSASVNWTVSGSTWSIVASAGPDQRTPNIASLVQILVNKPTWNTGNAMAFYLQGTGTREVESYDGDAPKAALLYVDYSAPTGIEELSDRSSVTAYPNPFKNAFSLNVETAAAASIKIAVYDVTGSLVESTVATQNGSGIFQYQTSASLPAGMYFVKVNVNNKQHLIKVISE